jgi:hypothetical protein
VKIWNPDIGSVRLVMSEAKDSQIMSEDSRTETGCDLIRGSVIFEMLVQRCNGLRKFSLSIIVRLLLVFVGMSPQFCVGPSDRTDMK